MPTCGTEFQYHANIKTYMYMCTHVGARDILNIYYQWHVILQALVQSITLPGVHPSHFHLVPICRMVLLWVDRPDIQALIQAMGELVVSRMLDPLIAHHRLFHMHPLTQDQ